MAPDERFAELLRIISEDDGAAVGEGAADMERQAQEKGQDIPGSSDAEGRNAEEEVRRWASPTHGPPTDGGAKPIRISRAQMIAASEELGLPYEHLLDEADEMGVELVD